MNMAAHAATVAALALWFGPSLPHSHIETTVSDAAIELPSIGMPDIHPALTYRDLPRPWRKLAMCESSGRVDAVAGSRGQFQGLFQIEYPRTWVAHGGDPDVSPTAANVYDQFMVALHIYEDRGAAPWPWCGRFLRAAYGR